MSVHDLVTIIETIGTSGVACYGFQFYSTWRDSKDKKTKSQRQEAIQPLEKESLALSNSREVLELLQADLDLLKDSRQRCMDELRSSRIEFQLQASSAQREIDRLRAHMVTVESDVRKAEGSSGRSS